MITLAMDIGSSSIKAGVFRGRTLLRSSKVELITRAEGSRVEIPAEALLRAMERAIRDALRGGPRPDVVAFDTFSPGLVVIDRAGRIVAGAITHQDRRSVDEARALEKQFSAAELVKITGNVPVPGGIASTSLLWLARHEPQVLSRGCRVGFVGSLVLRHLTGEWKTDPANATFMGLWNIRTREWDRALCRAVKVAPEALPQVVFGDTVLGRTREEISKRLGLAAGTPVVGGLIDTSAALLATPLKPGQLVHNAGSTDVLALCLDRPKPNATIMTRPLGTGAVFPERWLAVSTIAAAGSAVQWARRMFFADLRDEAFLALLTKQCRVLEKDPDAAAPLTFTAYLAGDRNQIEVPTAVLSGLTLGTTREEILLSLLAGLVAASSERFARLKRVRRIQHDVYVAGGGAPLARAMHACWGEKGLRFKAVRGDALVGLVRLAERVGGARD